MLICQKDFVNDLINKVISPKMEPPELVQKKVLSMIQSWAHAFSPDPDMRGVAEIYMELKRKGVEFPPPTDDDLLLVASNQSSPVSRPSSSASSSSGHPPPHHHPPPHAPVPGKHAAVQQQVPGAFRRTHFCSAVVQSLSAIRTTRTNTIGIN